MMFPQKIYKMPIYAGLAEAMKAVGEILGTALTGGNDEGNVKKAAKG